MLLSVFFALLAITTPVSPFVSDGKRCRRSWRREPVCFVSVSASSSTDPAARFHTDMYRVLESRENSASNIASSLSSLERRSRPALLTDDIDGAQRVAGMLRHMMDIGVATEESYQIVMRAFSRRGRLRWRVDGEDSPVVCAADEVGVLFDELWEKQNGNVSVETCNIALEAFAACSTPRGDRNYAAKAQQVLDNMKSSGMTITAESLDHVIHAWAWEQENLTPGICAEKAQKCFEELLELEPDVETLMQGYRWLLEAWSKSSSEGSPQKAESIFKKMLEIRQKNPKCMFPDAHSYANAVLAWTKSREQSAEKAHALLQLTIKSYENGLFPDGEELELIAFNGVIAAWGRIGRADKAEEVLWMAENARLVCGKLEPNVVTYNSVLHAYVRSKGSSDALERVIAIIDYMEKNSDFNPRITPDTFTYSMLLKAWVQSNRRDKAYHAMQCLEKMCELWASGDTAMEPHSSNFNIVINALAKTRDDSSARKAHGLLLKMQTIQGCEPDIVTYTSVIDCFAKSSEENAANISMELLQQAIDIYEETQRDEIMPNLMTYSVAIQAMSTNPTLENVKRARGLLTQLLDRYHETGDKRLRPNPYPFNYVLNCAANFVGTEREKLQAFQVAAQTYSEIRKSKDVRPDSFTYSFWFKACNNLLPQGDLREKGVLYSFDQCAIDGLVSPSVLKRLLAGTPVSTLSKIIDKITPETSAAIYRQLTVDDLPPNWSRNVR